MIYRSRPVSFPAFQRNRSALRALIREIYRRETSVLSEGIFDFIKDMLAGFATIAVDAYNMAEAVKPNIEFPEYNPPVESAPETPQGGKSDQSGKGDAAGDDTKGAPPPSGSSRKFNPKEDPGDQVYAALLMIRVVNSKTSSALDNMYINSIEEDITKIAKSLTEISKGTSEAVKKADKAFNEKANAAYNKAAVIAGKAKEEADKVLELYAEQMNKIYEESSRKVYSDIIKNLSSETASLRSYLLNVEFPNEVGKDWYQRMMAIGRSIERPKESDTAKDIILRHLKAVKTLEAIKLKENSEQIIESKPVKALLSTEMGRARAQVYVNSVRTEIGRYGLPEYKARLEKLVPKLIQIDKLMGEAGTKIQEKIKEKEEEIKNRFKAQAPAGAGAATPKAEPNALLNHYTKRGSRLRERRSVFSSKDSVIENHTLRILIGQIIKSLT